MVRNRTRTRRPLVLTQPRCDSPEYIGASAAASLQKNCMKIVGITFKRDNRFESQLHCWHLGAAIEAAEARCKPTHDTAYGRSGMFSRVTICVCVGPVRSVRRRRRNLIFRPAWEGRELECFSAIPSGVVITASSVNCSSLTRCDLRPLKFGPSKVASSTRPQVVSSSTSSRARSAAAGKDCR